MYNSELKTRFIRGYTQSLATAKQATTIFNAFEPYELKWDADLCTRTAEELQPVVDSVVGLRYKNRWIAISILKEYVKYQLLHPQCMNVAILLYQSFLPEHRKYIHY